VEPAYLVKNPLAVASRPLEWNWLTNTNCRELTSVVRVRGTVASETTPVAKGAILPLPTQHSGVLSVGAGNKAASSAAKITRTQARTRLTEDALLAMRCHPGASSAGSRHA
jgi:hypothetical protein